MLDLDAAAIFAACGKNEVPNRMAITTKATPGAPISEQRCGLDIRQVAITCGKAALIARFANIDRSTMKMRILAQWPS